MSRTSKQEEKRARSPRKRRGPSVSTGPKKDNLAKGYKEHPNAVEGELSTRMFIPKI
jgi:hypothetical protein